MTTLLAVVLALPTGVVIGWRHHAATVRVERAIRRQPIGLEDGVIRVALAAACCETWWTSTGAEHDHQCTRKGQTA
ncbi:hypothetical protein ACF1G4_03370 [Streptomyces caelestis]